MATRVMVPIQCPDRLLFSTWAYSVAPWLVYAGLNALWLSGNWPAPLGMAAAALALFGPGLALIPPLFGGEAAFDAAETAGLAAALSLAVGGIIGVALTWTQIGLQLGNYLGAMWVFTSLCLIAAYLRRNSGRRSLDREGEDPSLTLPALKEWGRSETLAAALRLGLAALALCGAIALARSLQQPPAGPYFTAFYLLNADGSFGGFPDSRQAEEPVQIRFGIVNHEAAAAHYQVCTRLGAQVLSCSDALALQPERLYEETVTLDLPPAPAQAAAAPVRVQFVLLRNGIVYRTLHLWLS